MAEILYLGVRQGDPAFTREKALEVVREMGEAKFRELVLASAQAELLVPGKAGPGAETG